MTSRGRDIVIFSTIQQDREVAPLGRDTLCLELRVSKTYGERESIFNLVRVGEMLFFILRIVPVDDILILHIYFPYLIFLVAGA